MTLRKIPCPECGSSQTPALQPYPDGTGYCFSCQTAFSDPYNGIVMDKNTRGTRNFEDQDDENDNWDNPGASVMSAQDLIKDAEDFRDPWRGVEVSTFKRFNVHAEYKNEELIKQYCPSTKSGVVQGWNIRDCVNKDFYSVGSTGKEELFGQSKCESVSKRNILVHEGQMDCMATWQMLASRNKKQDCVAIRGANPRGFRDNWEFLNQYQNILIIFDNDKPGQENARKIPEMFEPGKVKIVHLPADYKDTNDILLDEKVDGPAILAGALRSATEQRPEGIVGVDDIMEEALEDLEQGLPYPWEEVTEMTGGIRLGHLVTVTAGSGSGKTVFGREMLHHLVIEHDKKVGFMFLEERAPKTLRTLAGMEKGKMYQKMRKDVIDLEEFKKDCAKFRDKAHFYDSFGANNWETVKAKIRYFVQGLGVQYIVLDNLTALTAEESDEYGALNAIMAQLAALCIELNIHIQVISHLRKAANGKSFEEGGQVSSMDLRGSSSINFWSFQIISVERNTQHIDQTVRNTSTIRMLKDREDGRVGETATLFYNRDTGRWIPGKAIPEEDF